MKSPFKFLDSYTKDDREIFFGRDKEIEELYQKVFESKILLVYGVSGTGKSSLIHCGLANKFQNTDWLPIVIRRGANIIESMSAGIKAASVTAGQDKTGKTVSKKDVLSLYLDYYKPVFFIFDQFEELFIFGDKEERRSFINIVKSLVESELQCRLIFIMREEYMAGVTEFEKFIPTFFANRVRIEKMSHRNALEAVKGPCRISNISLEEGFAESLLEKLSPGEKDVELTYLQVFLDKIFRLATANISPVEGEPKGGSPSAAEKPEESLSFTLNLLQKTGNVSDLLGSFLDEQIALMEDPEAAMSVLKAFISGKGTKRPVDETEVINNVRSLGKEISLEKVKELILAFVNLRVLRDKDDNGTYELRHDALAEKIFEKFSTAEKELLEIRQMIENAYQYYLKRKILLNNDDLNYISDKDSLLNLNDELKAFLDESRKLKRARARTLRRLIVASAIVFLIMLLALGYFAFTKFSKVNADYLAIKSINQLPNPVEALSIAGKAWQKYPGVLQKEALLKSINSILDFHGKDSVINKITEKIKIQFDTVPVNIQYATCSRDNKYIYGYGDSLLFIWNLTGELERTIKTDHSPVMDMKISHDGWYIGAVSSDSLLTVWHATGKKQYSTNIPYNKLNNKQLFCFTKDNNILCVSKKHDAVLLDSEGKVLQKFDKHKGRVNAINISEDNNFFATASSDKTITIWYFNSVKKKYDYYNTLDWHKDTVWSISFSHERFTVISSSADSLTVIGNVNNKHYFSLHGRTGFCFAEFTPSDRGFIQTAYNRKDKRTLFTSYAWSYRNPKIEISNKFAISGKIAGGDLTSSGYKFSYITFSKDDNYYVCGEKDNFSLVDNRMFMDFDRSINNTMMEIRGEKPFFTADGKYLLTIINNGFRVYLIDPETIFTIYNR